MSTVNESAAVGFNPQSIKSKTVRNIRYQNTCLKSYRCTFNCITQCILLLGLLYVWKLQIHL